MKPNDENALFLPDGSRHWAVRRSGRASDAEAIGRAAGAALKAAAGDTYARDLK